MKADLLGQLNPAQRQAVTAAPGPLLILAGAGSGKTRAIAYRIAYLLQELDVPPSGVVAVTFTNKAAAEMRQRVLELVEEAARPIWIQTFHALSLRLLRSYGHDIGLPTGFSVYDEDDRRRIVRQVLRELSLSERRYPIGRLVASLSARKNLADDRSPGQSAHAFDPSMGEAIFSRYERGLREAQALDFDDLLLNAVRLLAASEKARAFAARRFQHVLVDEYQDTNRVQYDLLRLLAPHGRLFVVGDEDQSIYSFRGADLRNILDFERDFPGARTFKLEENYRSTSAILEAAGALIAHNQERKGKRLRGRGSFGQPPRLYAAESDLDEASYVAACILDMRRQSPPPGAAVLYRTHAQSRLFEEELVRRGIPYRLVGGLRFYERREVKDALCYLRLLVHPHEPGAFRRAVQTPSRGIGPSTLTLIEARAREEASSLWEAARAILADEAGILPGRAARGLRQFFEVLDLLAAEVARFPLTALVQRTLEKSGLLDALSGESPAEVESRRENLRQLVSAAVGHEEGPSGLESFLDAATLSVGDEDADDARCALMTLHSAKGLEFDAVFLTGLEEGLFPHLRSLGNRRFLEEERRLCYVGMTRARRFLCLTYAQSRLQAAERQGRIASRFVNDIPENLLRRVAGPSSAHADPPTRRRAVPAPSPDASRATRPAVSPARLRPGAMVRHPLFGEGTVIASELASGEEKLTVRFRRVGPKKLVARYAGLELLRS